jgi:hypothetical protein
MASLLERSLLVIEMMVVAVEPVPEENKAGEMVIAIKVATVEGGLDGLDAVSCNYCSGSKLGVPSKFSDWSRSLKQRKQRKQHKQRKQLGGSG